MNHDPLATLCAVARRTARARDGCECGTEPLCPPRVGRPGRRAGEVVVGGMGVRNHWPPPPVRLPSRSVCARAESRHGILSP